MHLCAPRCQRQTQTKFACLLTCIGSPLPTASGQQSLSGFYEYNIKVTFKHVFKRQLRSPHLFEHVFKRHELAFPRSSGGMKCMVGSMVGELMSYDRPDCLVFTDLLEVEGRVSLRGLSRVTSRVPDLWIMSSKYFGDSHYPKR